MMAAVAVSALVLSIVVAWERQSNRYAAIAAYHADRIKIEGAREFATNAARHQRLGEKHQWRGFRC